MSINLYLQAKISATLPNGRTKTLSEEYPLIQTSTEETYKILASKDRLKAYLKYLRSEIVPYEEKVYAEDDWDFKNPLRYEMIDDYPEKESEIKSWLKEKTDEGWEIEWFAA